METAAYAFSSVSDAMSFQMGNLLAMPLFKVSVKSIAEPSYTGGMYWFWAYLRARDPMPYI